ncbi:hypothetical protein EUGRSUZ_E00495 [Eucalyptus grandis]|uniref:Uncharacterized protein n=2 Tax=Eucalyptus grandis TaxID=71139 RepID=A0ACC3KS80_EUCGR|nr:hypothetical protein EUGRSUZ_E00495 [Eucalyptus grandis]
MSSISTRLWAQSTLFAYCGCSPGFAASLYPVRSVHSRRHGSSKCKSGDFSEPLEPETGRESPAESIQLSVPREQLSIVEVLKNSNSFLPHVVLASTLLALIYPPSFAWFTNRYYPPAIGFLMFAVGINFSERDFLEAFKRPAAIFAGYIGQYIVKPLLGYFFGMMSVTMFSLPTSIGAGNMLVSCVSGAQLSNYATFLTDPSMAPLSIVMTSLSTATAVFVTPLLSLLLIGKRLPVDVKGMVSSILQIVVAPITAGMQSSLLALALANRFFQDPLVAVPPAISTAMMSLMGFSLVMVWARGRATGQ